MADYAWSTSTCRPDTQWYGYPGQGAYYASPWGTHWVGSTHAAYASLGYECGRLGPPVKDYGWVSEFGAYGQWFLGGVLFYRSGGWWVAYGNFGQTGVAAFAGTLSKPELLHQAPEPPERERHPALPPFEPVSEHAPDDTANERWIRARLATDYRPTTHTRGATP